tara:strand:+ start:894 stop:1367 length:474 start_codon:yes stop_codon:yes gene_type:complete
MREEYQKSVILFSIILIFGGLYYSTLFDIGSVRRSNGFLFTILIACALVGFLQTKKLKRWREEKKTDYTFVYWSFFWLTVFLVGYCGFMIVTRSELECMRILRNNMRGAGNKIYYEGSNKLNHFANNNGAEGSGISANYLLEQYKNIWRGMMFWKKS